MVFQAKVLVEPNGCWMAKAPPGGATKNWKSGVSQPAAVAVKVMVVPVACGEAGLGERLVEEQRCAAGPLRVKVMKE